LSEDKSKVKRISPIPENYNPDTRTIYAENIPADSTHDSLTTFFSQIGNVQYVSLPKFEDKRIKGFAFVEFE
jgi:RNA recognition motif-containing protein